MNDYIIALLIYLACVAVGTVAFRWLDPESTTYLKALKFMSIGFAIGTVFVWLVFIVVDYIMK